MNNFLNRLRRDFPGHIFENICIIMMNDNKNYIFVDGKNSKIMIERPIIKNKSDKNDKIVYSIIKTGIKQFLKYSRRN